jgi:hypothetical protein
VSGRAELYYAYTVHGTIPADDARSEGFFGEKAVTKGRVRCFSTWSEQRAKAERLRCFRKKVL